MAYWQFSKDYVKYLLIRIVTKLFSRFSLPIDQVFSLLRAKGHLGRPLKAIELFGMHGLWHTVFYLKEVEHLDMFELDPTYSSLSKIPLGKSKVSFHCADSLKYIKETSVRYDLVVADTPMDLKFYRDDGLAIFFEDLFRVTNPSGIIIFNIHTNRLKDFRKLEELVRTNAGTEVKDMFYCVRNEIISYAIVVLGSR